MTELINSPYDHFKAYDAVKMLQPLIDEGSHYFRLEDGKAKVKLATIPSNAPWLQSKGSPGLNCLLWHTILFDRVVPYLPAHKKFVPIGCQSCWKVVVKPRTLQQLFNLHEMQKKLDLPSKAGIELRKSVPGLYGGYFYNRSLEQGLACYDIVKSALLENRVLAPLVDEVDEYGKTTRIILKRGCTELEHLLGDSSKWQITPEQEFIENLVKTYIVDENATIQQPEHFVWNIKRRWIEFAWEHGDPTYMLYTGGKPLYPPYVTYHQPELLQPERDEILFRKF